MEAVAEGQEELPGLNAGEFSLPFRGSIQRLCDVDVSPYVEWVKGVPQEEWRRLTDFSWRDWGVYFFPLVDDIMKNFPYGKVKAVGIWELEPHTVHAEHIDDQVEDFLARVHIPLITNPHVVFTMPDGEHHMEVGGAYLMNTLAPHGVSNMGETSRLHVVIDVRGEVQCYEV